ncbi:GNAT family N-acetyltransferase [Desulfospira joergensenii]|uniref:GNAT family N-acetyltransferase n=1 Tax=Desulfospira joergensenii TaxID=53329 RepID=UPI0003B3BFBC|nr:GNAT family N-acetyltransferase [Desulfospira joergensenii]
MKKKSLKNYEIRLAGPGEYEDLGRMTARAYEELPGMPGLAEQPDYYSMIQDVEGRAALPGILIFVAVSPGNDLLGGVTFVGNMAYYHSGGSAGENTDYSGIRLLAVRPGARNIGVGRALTGACIQRAAQIGRRGVILHTTDSMKVAWKMYERMGFSRSPDLDFIQGQLSVFGFRLKLDPAESNGRNK